MNRKKTPLSLLCSNFVFRGRLPAKFLWVDVKVILEFHVHLQFSKNPKEYDDIKRNPKTVFAVF